jgi:hypothetical protein
VPHAEVLSQPDKGVIHSGVSVGMVLA